MTKSEWCLDEQNLDNASFKKEEFRQDLGHIKRIKAQCNYFTSMAIVSGRNIEELDLSKNRVAKLELASYPSLRVLELTTNKIEEITEAEHMVLEELFMGNSPLYRVNERLWRMPQLKKLQVCDAQISNINFDQMNCPQL